MGIAFYYAFYMYKSIVNMEKLKTEYKERLDEIAEKIQSSEILELYLEEEEEEQYKELIEEFEDKIDEIYSEVADNYPLQIIDLENTIMDERFEGLYLSRLIGYSVLRGVINDKYKYLRSQPQFQKVLLFICNNPNFEMISKRVGQGIQLGFALSSDIWITNLIDRVNSRRAVGYLRRQKRQEFRDIKLRKALYEKYKDQFASLNFYTSKFPTTEAEVNLYYHQLKDFLVERVLRDLDGETMKSYIKEFVESDEVTGSLEYIYLLGLVVNYFRFEDEMKDLYSARLNKQRKENKTFIKRYFVFLRELLDSRLKVYPDCDLYVSSLLDKEIEDDLSAYYNLTDTIHGKGYVHPETQEEIRGFYYQHDGLSTINECVRLTILKYFNKVLDNLEAEEYHDYFEINKTFSIYMNIFQNKKFNQEVKNISLRYIRGKLFKTYTNKRAKDYQDIKKFITATFKEHKLMNDKQLKELFKTKRKRRPAKK